MITARSTVSAAAAPSHAAQIFRELIAATPLFTLISALRGR